MSDILRKVRYVGFCFCLGVLFAWRVFRDGKISKNSSPDSFRAAQKKRKEIEDTEAADVVAQSGCDGESERAISGQKAEFRKRVRDRLGENLQRK